MKKLEKQQFIEEFGDRMDEFGLPHMYGRVLGALLVCEKPMMSMQELAEVLRASHGSISMATQMLTRLGIIVKVSVPGERKHFYRVGHDAWTASFTRKIDYLEQMRQLADEGLRLLEDTPKAARRSLEHMRLFFGFFHDELEGISDRWKQYRGEHESKAK